MMDTQAGVTSRISQLCHEEYIELLSGLNNRTAWNREGDLGYGNQVVSAAHDNRTILELIQNARDAIVESEEETNGRVAVIVGPESLLIANSGEPFHLDDDDVFEAVTSLGRSAKAKERDSIGEKGVGLKSILQLSEAFSIHSSVDGEDFSATFSRAKSAQMVLSMYERLLDTDSFVDRLGVTETQSDFLDTGRFSFSDQSVVPDSIDIDELVDQLLNEPRQPPPTPVDILTDIPRISLFRYPFLQNDTQADSTPLQTHLIRDNVSSANLSKRVDPQLADWLDEYRGDFSTVVELEYLDDQWRDLLDHIESVLTTSDKEGAATFTNRRSSEPVDRAAFCERRRREFWEECTDISPETLILLEEIEELDLIQVTHDETGQLQIIDRHQVCIDQADQRSIDEHSNTTRRSVDYTVQTADGTSQTRQYRRYTRTYDEIVPNDDQDERDEIHLLFERPPESTDDWNPSPKPLYLHYPIEKATTPFPFVVHAPFRVEFDRQSLADDQQNLQILDRLPDLIADAGTDLARGDERGASRDGFRQWMPWMTMPLRGEPSSGSGTPLTESVQEAVTLLQDSPIVPTDDTDAQCPRDTLLDPERIRGFETLRRDAPEAPLPAETVIESGDTWSQRVSTLQGDTEHTFRQCARRLGLTEVLERLFDDDTGNARGCIDILCEYWGLSGSAVSSGRWAVPVERVEHAEAYFETICSILTSASEGDELDLDDDSDVKRAAGRLGEKRVPLIPAEAHQANDTDASNGVTHLVRARSRGDTRQGHGAQRSERIVFRRTGSSQTSESIISELPSPPTTLPVFVVPFRTEWIGPLESFNRDWGTRNLDSPAEFYRRVAAEAGGYSGERTSDSSVIGYLSTLYETVTRGQIAKWLHPIPNRNRRFDEVEATLTGAKTNKLPSDYDDYLERRYTQQVELPIGHQDGQDETLPAEQIVFGTEWVSEFEAAADILEGIDSSSDRFFDAGSHEESRATTFRRWAAVIEKASSVTPSETPTLAEPESDYWQRVFGSWSSSEGLQRVLRLDFLIHLGVQIGPRIDWRWVLPTRGDDDREAGTISVADAQNLARGEPLNEDDGFDVPDEVLDTYTDVMWRSDNHPAFTATHSTGCGNNWLECDEETWAANDSQEALMPVWWYFPDLPQISDGRAREKYRDAILLLWPDLAETVANSAWLCSNWHSFSESPDGAAIPSLGTVQLAQAELWPVDSQFEDEGGNDRLTVEDGTTASAEKLIFDDAEQVRGAAQYLPRVDSSKLEQRLAPTSGSEAVDISSALRILGIREIDNLTPPMAAQRLNWFIGQFAVEKTPGQNPFDISASWSARALSVPIDALMRRLASGQTLADRLDERPEIRRWIRRDIWRLGTTVRITEGRNSKALKIGAEAPAPGAPSIAQQPVIFTQPLSSFSRDRLVRDARPFVERPSDSTEVARLLGTESSADEEATTVTFGIIIESEPPSPRPVSGGEVESGTDRLDTLRETLRQRQQYLLAAYLEQATAPDLEEKHDQLSAVVENRIAIVARDDDDDTQRNSAQWEPADGAKDGGLHIALFEDAVKRVDGDAIPPYLTADGIVQVLEQFDLADTFENVLFKGESALETEYRSALEEVRAEINELRTQRLEVIHHTLQGLVSTIAPTVSLTEGDELTVNARVTLNELHRLEDDPAAVTKSTLLQSWLNTLTEKCGFDNEVAIECIRAAATDDEAVRHRITYQLDQSVNSIDIDALVKAGYRWQTLETWPSAKGTAPVESYSTTIQRFRRFWNAVGRYEDEGEATLERAAKDAREATPAPKPNRRVAQFVPHAETLPSDICEVRLGALPYLKSTPEPLEHLRGAVRKWGRTEWEDLKQSDVIYTDQTIEERMESLIEAATTPNGGDKAFETALAKFYGTTSDYATDEGRTREDLTNEWLQGRDESLDSLASQISADGSASGGGSPTIGDSSGGEYGQPNVGIDARGREGELICLNRAWQRFQAAPVSVRSSILDRLETWRGHDRWRLKSVDEIATSWTSSGAVEATSPADVLRTKNLAETSDTRMAFHALFDTSAERGPGFDLIDPFAAMPETESVVSWTPEWMYRVESKAVAAERMRSGRIKLTGNELRMALRPGPLSPDDANTDQVRAFRYIIRLVGFSTDWRSDNDRTVNLLDIDNVDEFVGIEREEREILEKLRGGSFYISFYTEG
ncbi:hypothetical protein SAMN04488065_2580 [Haloplanus vescus]|uniref:Uncharacterized protein n=2 Tax=Haloplanus vescus TaxID=555874 RepID=A0A1H4A0R9_9EURY|nr:hypothetical protein SAMN04488065_2486 [Haloplanus vescus]SEA29576.1 hypothetical protein SAMN04488065_2580 [Haloplanus vescus]